MEVKGSNLEETPPCYPAEDSGGGRLDSRGVDMAIVRWIQQDGSGELGETGGVQMQARQFFSLWLARLAGALRTHNSPIFSFSLSPWPATLPLLDQLAPFLHLAIHQHLFRLIDMHSVSVSVWSQRTATNQNGVSSSRASKIFIRFCAAATATATVTATTTGTSTTTTTSAPLDQQELQHRHKSHSTG